MVLNSFSFFRRRPLAAFLAASALLATTARAHNLDANAVYVFYDSNTQAFLDARIAGGWVAGTPLLQNGDEIGLIIKAVPDNGTNTGVGGYSTFYLPNGVQVIDAAYLQPGDDPSDGIDQYDKVPMKGQALMPNVGAGGGPTVSLVGLSRGPNIAGVTANLVNGANVNNGTLPGVYGDLGIFYSTAPETAYSTYSGGTLTNNSGDTVGSRTNLGTPLNVWDAWQMAGYGIKGTTNPAYPTTPLLDSNGRGTTGWGLASAVAGPESGYAWEFDFNQYVACDPSPYAPSPACLNAATSSVGPWQRIQYPGSQIAYDVPGDITAGKFNGGLDASDIGFDLTAGGLPATTGQSNGTPNAIRWGLGQLTLNTPEFAWVKIRIVDFTAMLDPSGCPIFNIDTFGGDAGGDDDGKDHIWRYYDPNSRLWNGCLAVGKPATREAVRVGDTFQYNLKVYNSGITNLSNVVMIDTLPTGVTFLSSVPAQTSGPNPLRWNIGTLAAGQSYSAVVTVRASATGVLTNTVTVTGNPPVGPPITSSAQERTPSGFNIPLLKQSKSASPTAVMAPGSVQYTVTIENIGSGSTGNPVKITENLPSGFTYLSLASAVVNGATVTGSVAVNNTNPSKPVFTVPFAIQPTRSLVLVFNASVAAATPSGNYCNSFVTNQNGVNISTGSLACVDVGGGTIGDTVFRDWDGDGVQGPDEEGLAGVTLSLYAGACPPVGLAIDTETTDASGFYQFTGLGAGTYCVDSPTAGSGGLPSGYSLTTGNDPTTVTLATSEVRSDVDFGYRPGGTGSIGDTVFDDKNADGLFNGADVGIPSVTVRLYEDSNSNGVIDVGTDALVAFTSTNGSGVYSFPGLATGIRYIVDVDDADADIANYFVGAYGNASGVVETTDDPHSVGLLVGAYTAADFGFYKTVPGSIGDDVFFDADSDGVRDPSEAGAPYITVYLYQDTDGDGVLDIGEPLLATTVTDVNGKYQFDNLPAGDFIVDLDQNDADIPARFAVTRDPIAVTLLAAEVRTDIDFPLVSALEKSVDLLYDNPAVAPNTLTYSLTPRFPGADLFTLALIKDVIPTGTTFIDNPPTSANAGGTGVDETDPADGIIDYVEWNLGASTPSSPGYTGGTVPPVCQTTLTLTADRDTWIMQSDLDQNRGTDTSITTTNAADDNVGLLHFNVSNGTIPAGATFDGAQLFLAPDSGAGTNRQIEIHNLLTSWTEGTSANAACTSSGNGAAWQGPNCTDDWLSAGGNFGSSDYSATNLGTLNPTTNDVALNITGASLDSVVSAWLSGSTNRGFAMIPVGSNATSVLWHPRTSGTANLRPRLVITYTPNGCSGTTTISETGGGEAPDAFIQEDSAATNFGTNTRLRQRPQSSAQKHSLIRFSLASIPSGATVTSASLGLNVRRQKNNDVDQIRRMLTPWVEGSTGANGVSWNDSNGTGTGGDWVSGTFSSSDYSATVEATITPSTTGAKTANITSLVQNWYDGTYTNNGLVLLATGTNTSDVEYYSGEEGTTSRRPSLTVNWSVSPAGATGLNTIATGWTLAQNGDSFPITMTLTNDDVVAITSVAPSSISVTGTNGADASCTGPTPATATVPATGSTTFSWTCTITAVGTDPGSVTFAASATNGTTTWSTATSNGVIVSPVLQFQVDITNPPGVDSIDNNATFLNGATLLATSNTVQTAVTSAIGDYVWLDVDADGVQDAGEPGLAGVRVFRDLDADGEYDVGEPFDITDSGGGYLFTGLANGSYSVVLDTTTLPVDHTLTTPGTLSRTITAGGQQILNADFGVTLVAGPDAGSIGDTVWIDSNEDGIVDVGEAGIPGVTVRLYRDVNNDGIVDVGDFLASTTTTDASGNYLFPNLYPSDYLVVVDTSASVTTPFGVVTTIAAAMDLVSGTNPADVTLTSGLDYTNADFGFNWGGSIGDFAWQDKDGDGIQDGPAMGCDDSDPVQECPAAGMTAVLFYDLNGDGEVDGDPILAVFETGVDGYYIFENLPPGNYIVYGSEQEVLAPASSANAGQIGVMVHTTAEGKPVALGPNEDYTAADFGFLEAAKVEGHVFHDADRNGIFDGSESPIAGITVTLTGTDINGFPVSLSTMTNVDGEYDFLVPPGDYSITYDDSAPPMPVNLTDATTATITFISVLAGQEVVDLDFGLDDGGRIGDFIWNDADGDGIQDAGENGISGVTVLLWLDPNGDGNLSDATILDAMATGSGGNYLFLGLSDNVGAARYVVVVDETTTPAGFTQTGDPDEAGTCVTCDAFSVTQVSGGLPVLTRDFGYRAAVPRNLSGTVFTDDGSGGGTASNGLLDGTETGVGAGVLVVAEVDSDGDGNTDFVTTTTTNGSGAYSFLGLPSGANVIVTVDESTLPSPLLVRTNDVDGGSDATIVVSNLVMDVSGRDFGYIAAPGSIAGSVCVGSGDGSCDDPGETPGQSGVTVVLRWAGPDNILGSVDDVEVTTTTDALGNYVFDASTVSPLNCTPLPCDLDLGLPAGIYQVSKANPPGYDSLADVDGGNADVISVVLGAGENRVGRDFELSVSIDLSIVKSDSGAGVIVGNTFTYALTVTNNSLATATNVTVVDTLDTETTYVSDTGGCSNAMGTLTCNLGSLAGGASTTFNVTVTVDATAPTSGTLESGACNGSEDLCNVATVNGDQDDPDPSDDTADEPTDVRPTADLAIAKVDATDPVNTGGTEVYTLTVANAGPHNATNVVVTDTLPPATTYVSNTGGCVHALGVLTCNLGTLASGASTNFTVTVTVSPTAPTAGSLSAGPCNGTEDICNSVSVTATEQDPDPSDNTDSEPTDVRPTADVSITKVDLTDPVLAGGALSYSLTVANAGPQSATNVVVTDILDADTTYVSNTGGCTEALGVLTCNIGTLASGASQTFTVSVTVDAGAPTAGTLRLDPCNGSEDLCNNVSVTLTETDPTPANNTDDEPTDVTTAGLTGLTLSKSDLPDPVLAGATLVYTLNYSNTGSTTLVNARVVETYDVRTTFVSATPPADLGNNTWFLGSLEPGETGSISITMTVNGALADGTVLNNHAELSADGAPPATVDETTTVRRSAANHAALGIVKTVSPSVAPSGSLLTYTVTASNSGPAISYNTIVSDVLPAGLTYMNATPVPSLVLGNYIEWNVGNLPAGSSRQFVVYAETVSTLDAGTLIENCAEAAGATGPGTVASAGLSAQGCATASITGAGQDCRLVMTKRGVGIAQPGGEIVYRCLWCDPCVDAPSVFVVDDLPPEVEFVSVSSRDMRGFQLNDNSGLQQLVLDIGVLPKGRAGIAYIRTRVKDNVPPGTVVSNEIRIEDAAGRTKSDTDLTTIGTGVASDVNGLPSLRVTGNTRAKSGGSVQYMARYSNLAPGSTAMVTLTDTVNPTYVSPAPTTRSTRSLVWKGLSGSGIIKVKGKTVVSDPAFRGGVVSVEAMVTGPDGSEVVKAGVDTALLASTSGGGGSGGGGDTPAAGSSGKASLTAPSFVRAGLTSTLMLRYSKLVGASKASMTVPEGVGVESTFPRASSIEGNVIKWDGLAATSGILKVTIVVPETVSPGASLTVGATVTDDAGAVGLERTMGVR